MQMRGRRKLPRRFLFLAFAACVSLGVWATCAAAAGPFAYGPEQLELVRSERLSERLVELRFRGPALVGDSGVHVLLPGGYDTAPERRYPVLYLLHGCCNGDTGYRLGEDIIRLTAGEEMIIVSPDSGPNWGYVDWHNQGAGGPPMWETYHLGQLLPWIDQNFRTKPSRAVAGVSMGGYGAMHYAARHPDLFVAAASFSGAVNTNSIFLQAVVNTDGLWWNEKRVPTSTFGPRQTEEVRWRGHNPWDLAENLAGLHLTLRTGNGQPGGPGNASGDTGSDASGDPVETEVHEESVSLHRRLVEFGIQHIWDDYGPGCHCGYYYLRGLKQLMPDLARVFADPPTPPSSFTYRSIDPAYEVYGWGVEIDRPALEWSELRDANRSGFGLRGSGRASVTTPPVYRPGGEVDIDVVRNEGVESRRVRVGDDCRLRLDVPLGPGNPYQQYTAQAGAHGVRSGVEDYSVFRYPEDTDTSGTAVYTAWVRIAADRTPGCQGASR